MRKTLMIAVVWLAAAGLLVGGCNRPKTTDAPQTADGQPVLADIGNGKFQITLAYFNAALDRVPVAKRARYLTAAGKREFLDRAIVEAVFYVEGVRRKFLKMPEFQKLARLRVYGALIDQARQEMLKGITVTDEEVRADYEKTVGDKQAHPYEEVAPELRQKLLAQRLDEAVQAKKKELAEEWGVKFDDELLAKLNPKEMTKAELIPNLEAPLAQGKDYTYTVAQLLKRLDETPPTARRQILDRDPKKLLRFVVGEDLIHEWAVKQGLDQTADFENRKKVVEVGTLSEITRDEIVGSDIEATEVEARAYYAKHKDDWKLGDRRPPFEAVKAQVIARVTEEQREAAAKGLAASLMAHRFPVIRFEPNIAEYLK